MGAGRGGREEERRWQCERGWREPHPGRAWGGSTSWSHFTCWRTKVFIAAMRAQENEAQTQQPPKPGPRTPLLSAVTTPGAWLSPASVAPAPLALSLPAAPTPPRHTPGADRAVPGVWGAARASSSGHRRSKARDALPSALPTTFRALCHLPGRLARAAPAAPPASACCALLCRGCLILPFLPLFSCSLSLLRLLSCAALLPVPNPPLELQGLSYCHVSPDLRAK